MDNWQEVGCPPCRLLRQGRGRRRRRREARLEEEEEERAGSTRILRSWRRFEGLLLARPDLWMGPGTGGGRRCRLVEAGTTLVPHRPIVRWSLSSLWVAFVSRYSRATSSSVSFFFFCPFPPLFFPRLFFLRFYLSTRCSSLLRCFVLFPSCTLFRALMIADETIRGGSVARVCFAVNWIGELRFECENVDPLHLKLARKIFAERSILRRNLSKWMLIFCWIYLIYLIKLGTFNGKTLGVLIRQFFNL